MKNFIFNILKNRFLLLLINFVFFLFYCFLTIKFILKAKIDKAKIDKSKSTIVVVSHDLSLTGAPLVAYNIALHFKKKYNVIFLSLNEGDLAKNFKNNDILLITLPFLRLFASQLFLNSFFLAFKKLFDIKFVLLNSIETRYVIKSIFLNNLRSVLLVHEFLSMTRPLENLDLIKYADDIVFSSKALKNDAIDFNPSFKDLRLHILPQGKCSLFINDYSCTEDSSFELSVREIVKNKDNKKKIILGVGTINIRKGVDLFVSVASKLAKKDKGSNYLFVWIGAGFDLKNDSSYSIYIHDQVMKNNLTDQFLFLSPSLNISKLYKLADLLFISSRLDPFPNVFIDAVYNNIPVVCFSKTSGIEEFLQKINIHQFCVANYLDVDDATSKIVAILKNTQVTKKIKNKFKANHNKFFNLNNYVKSIEKICLSGIPILTQINNNADLILSSKMLKRNFSNPYFLFGFKFERSIIKQHIINWRFKKNGRKLFPGFHPGIYFQEHGMADDLLDPTSSFIKSNMPYGPWANELITINSDPVLHSDHKVALHIHVYYVDLLFDIVDKLVVNNTRPDIFISYTNKNHLAKIEHILSRYNIKAIKIQLVPNKGRDIGPLITEFGNLIAKNYEFFGHFHTKKSLALKNCLVGKLWFRFLVDNMLSYKKEAMLDRIINAMVKDKKVGMVFPDDPNIIGWTKNRKYADSIAARSGIKLLSDNFIFPVGNMYWARTRALSDFLRLNLNWEDYPDEPAPYDGSIIHALERIVVFFVKKNNYKINTTFIDGVSR